MNDECSFRSFVWPTLLFLSAFGELTFQCEDNICLVINSTEKDNCLKESACEVFATIKLEDDSLYYKVQLRGFNSNKSFWVGLGLSEDTKMGDDVVFDCYSTPVENKSLALSYNQLRTKENVVVQPRFTEGVNFYYNDISENVHEWHWQTETMFEIVLRNHSTTRIDLEENAYYVLLAFGLIDLETGLKLQHKPSDAIVGDQIGEYTSQSSTTAKVHSHSQNFVHGSNRKDKTKIVYKSILGVLIVGIIVIFAIFFAIAALTHRRTPQMNRCPNAASIPKSLKRPVSKAEISTAANAHQRSTAFGVEARDELAVQVAKAEKE